jgi:AAA domain
MSVYVFVCSHILCSDAVHGYWNVAEADMILHLLQHFEAKYKVSVNNPQKVCVITMYNKQVMRECEY